MLLIVYLIHPDSRISSSLIIKCLPLIPPCLFFLNKYLCECAKSFIFFETEVPRYFLLILPRVYDRAIASQQPSGASLFV